MTEVRLRARTVSEIVDAAFALYRRDATQYTLLMAVAITPQLIMQIIVRPGARLGSASYVIAFISFLVSTFTYTLGTAAITKFGSAVYLGDEADLESTLRGVFPMIGRILWAGFLKELLYIIGFLFFFLGWLYVAARWFAVTSTIVLENARTGEAFARSTALSNGRKGHTLGTLALVGVIYFALFIGVFIIAAALKSSFLSLLLVSAFQIVAFPIVALANMLLYYDCRIRSEGFDIERMAASLGFDADPTRGPAGATP
jgi:hypothetical protein